IEEFRKVDLRVGEVLKAEHIPDTRLLRLEVDLGELGRRQIIAGIGDKYKAREMVGKKVIVVVNLEPKVIRGFKSEGMLLATEEKVLLTPEGEARNGSKVF
ncbi:MAG TPA: methionine--tRNA ligase, partial [Candidatus Aenigmarchaeota archaeon]|nr:methionine--tRNA ligase [Candidatus Aenigmarchaeota archaeon]